VTLNVNSPHARDIRSHLHPYTNADQHQTIGPHIFVRGEGIYVYDDAGKRYIEGLAGLWCAALGFSEKRLVDAATRQLNTLPFYHNFSHKAVEPAIELADYLVSRAPTPMSKVFFTNSGSEANDTAIRLIRHYWVLKGEPKRRIIISRKNAYHGSTIAAGSMGGMAHVHAHSYPVYEGFRHIIDPYWYGEAKDGESPQAFGIRAARALEEEILAVGPENVAAFAGEPPPAPVIAPQTSGDAAAPKDDAARMEVSGKVQLDLIYDFKKVDPAWNTTLRPSKIPINCPGGTPGANDPGCGKDGETIISPRQTAISFKGFVPTQAGQLKTDLSLDLFNVGGANTGFRLLRAWGEVGAFGAGPLGPACRGRLRLSAHAQRW